MLHHCGLKPVVRVDVEDPFARRGLQTGVPCGREALVFRMDKYAYIAAVFRTYALYYPDAPVRRAVVDENELHIGIALLHKGAGAALGIGLYLIYRYYDGNLHRFSSR